MRQISLGIMGEELASKYLQKKGYKVLERNFRTCFGEIDIIAEQRSTIVFIEVKTRGSSTYGRPEEAVNLAKQHQISRVAQAYLKKKGVKDRDCRFDVIGVYEDKGKVEFKLITNAFYLGNW